MARAETTGSPSGPFCPRFPQGKMPLRTYVFLFAFVFESLESPRVPSFVRSIASASSFVTCVEFEFCIAYTGCPG